MSHDAKSAALKIAIEEAERFLARCKDVMDEESRSHADYLEMLEKSGGAQWVHKYVSRAPHAAAKRASMDLTRALANLRKPGAF